MKKIKSVFMALSGFIFILPGYFIHIKTAAMENAPFYTINRVCLVLWALTAAVCKDSDFTIKKTVGLMSITPVFFVIASVVQHFVLKNMGTPFIGPATQFYNMALIWFVPKVLLLDSYSIVTSSIGIMVTLALTAYIGCKIKDAYIYCKEGLS